MEVILKKPSFNKDVEHLIVALVSDAYKAENVLSFSGQPMEPSGEVDFKQLHFQIHSKHS